MPLIPPKKKSGGQRKYQIGEISDMLEDIKAVYEMEVLKIKQKVLDQPNKQLGMPDHKILETCAKNLINLSQEERRMRQEEDFNKMSDDQLKKLAASALDTIKAPKRKKTIKPTEETTPEETTETGDINEHDAGNLGSDHSESGH